MTTYFEYYFRIPTHDSYLQQSERIDVINLEDEQWHSRTEIKYFKERLEHRAYLTQKYVVSNDVDSKFKSDLDLFFFNCYQTDTFMEDFGQKCICLNYSEFY